MPGIRLSLAIPYKQRLGNLRLVLEALAEQTLDSSEFEVVVGAMEYSPEYTALCRDFQDRLNIVSVLTSRDFEIPRARNLAMRQALGEVIVQIDADTLLPPDALRNLYDRHFSFGQDICVVGQVVGYGNNDRDVDEVRALPYAHYRDALARAGDLAADPKDPRFRAEHVIPWAFAWTGLIALRADTVRRHGLFFDETFRGWGVDDLEWGHRISASGTPIVLRSDVYGLHLPHTRDMRANQRTESANYRRFLDKWPGPDVELAHAVGDVEANRLYLDFLTELRGAAGGAGRSLGVARGTADGADVLVVGAVLDEEGRLVDPAPAALFDGRGPRVSRLVGLALPYEDKSVAECRVLPPVLGLSPRYRDAVRAEVDRVAKSVVLPAEQWR
ncbi:glycosyltransferase family 2 protein [Streptomyces sp. NPDC003247]|uniref:glycosyltransferase family 2 protein n=1 Tax=Streptomyces sp. NPDC003247 TaxID=3364677 RepID=UPI0036C351F4